MFGVELAVVWSGFGQNTMKTTLLVLFILCAAAAFGQSAPVLSNEASITQFSQHNQHAEIHAMATENSLVGGPSDGYGYAQGEQPLWQFGPVSVPTPLGDVARAYRKEKTAAKKAEFVFEKQGS
jgi:hypothetical protein